MFFVTYLRRELRRRMRQAIVIALGLAVGIGLVLTVTAASAGVRKAQGDVLSSLYGVGTDITVTGKAPKPPKPGSKAAQHGTSLQITPNGAEMCTNGKCHSAAGQTIDHLGSPSYGPMKDSSVASVAALAHVKAAAGGLSLTDNQITLPKHFGQPGSGLPQPNSFSVDGVDTSHLSLGPLSNATLGSGHSFTSADAGADVAVLDSGYARSHKLTVGSKVSIVGTKFTVIGIVTQPQGSSPPAVYIPLARAQALDNADSNSFKHKVNTIYVTADSAADISAVQTEIEHLLPTATVTTAASLAREVTGSLASTARLADDLGRWLSILVLAAAFAVASLLTVAAVARRVGEFGTLKALGWRSGRIISQVMGESVTTGLIGGAAGIGLGYAGAAIITSIAPKLTATLPDATGPQIHSVSSGVARAVIPNATHTVAVPLAAAVSPASIGLAVALAVAGGLIAGAFGSWRTARLRPADALAKVA